MNRQSIRIRTSCCVIMLAVAPIAARQAPVSSDTFADAKSAFDRKDLTTAAAGFDRVIALLDDGDVEDPTLADLRTLATGFRDLTHAAPPKPMTPAVEDTIKDPEPAPKDPTPPTAAVQSTLP